MQSTLSHSATNRSCLMTCLDQEKSSPVYRVDQGNLLALETRAIPMWSKRFCYLAFLPRTQAGQSFPNAGRIFDPYTEAYNPSNSQRYTLMAEDAVNRRERKRPPLLFKHCLHRSSRALEVLCQTTDVARSIRHLASPATENLQIAGALIILPRARTGAESSGQILKAGPRCTNIFDCGWRAGK